jgi:hypothetical protein
MKIQPQIIPQISIHPDRINVYQTIDYGGNAPYRKQFSKIAKINKETFGRLSVQSSRKLSKAADYLVFMASPKNIAGREKGKYYKFRLSFVTLTLSSKQIHPDGIIKNLFLNQFLVEAKKRWHVNRYVWRAEKQLNGNIHFHILLDKFIPWSELRDVWNRIQEKLGYVSRYQGTLREWHKNGFRPREDLLKTWPLKNQLRAFDSGSKSDWHNPNSTDIHSLKHVHNVKNYMVKYMTKNHLELPRFIRIKFLQSCIAENIPLSDDMQEEFEYLSQYFTDGRNWGCSLDLTDIKGGRAEIDSYLWDEIEKVRNSSQVRTYQGEYYAIYFIDINLLASLGCTYISNLFYGYLFDKWKFSQQLSVSSG